ncbi:MAG: 50S ribosomal protein L32 [Candidatus Yanofskybacteria bacterium CG10_big_fil_rev_8_21_14_0_10_46_23]|uniref:Large ribosomal subunit protein bL32 n=1 Tax=Candidatus Yanofskybacteria bacterium CG10_big_fil_rev_8_21_14_0_10_46_23 TaxID=1975098 RepID=A0A2H0R3Z4_9BACT|nr:MAG: 50S ribosomal protein L32 [Candidatus Yanofskybacteria bacterium CG10_big_fil_rev_8_21_14_0_10_46_23]
MPVPKKRQTKGRQGGRRSHIKLKLPKLVTCAHCNQPKFPHRLCQSCGFYNDRQVIDRVAQELKKKEKSKNT